MTPTDREKAQDLLGRVAGPIVKAWTVEDKRSDAAYEQALSMLAAALSEARKDAFSEVERSVLVALADQKAEREKCSEDSEERVVMNAMIVAWGDVLRALKERTL
jgi:hypothetical protein